MTPKTEITDLIPKGLGAYWLVFFLGVLSIGGLEFAFHKMPELAEKIGVESIGPLDLSLRGNLLDWGLSILLFMAACLSLFNFHAGRRYQDPASRVNAWFWWAVILVFLSMDVQIRFRETLRDILIAVSGTMVYQDGTVWWLSLYGFLAAVIGTRLFLDLSRYAPSLGLYLLAASGAVAGVLIRLELLPVPLDGREIIMLESALQGFVVLLLFLSFALFARRQVFRDPDIAIQWFARIWNYPLRTEEKQGGEKATEEKTASAIPSISKDTTPGLSAQVSASSSESLKPAEKPSSSSVSDSASNSESLAPLPSSRPVVQKTADVVPFRADEKKTKDDGFELSGTA